MIIWRQNEKCGSGCVITGEAMVIGISLYDNCIIDARCIGGDDEKLGIYGSPEKANYVARKIYDALSNGCASFEMPQDEDVAIPVAKEEEDKCDNCDLKMYHSLSSNSSSHSFNVLWRAGYHSLGDLKKASKSDLAKIKGLGQHSIDYLEKNGFLKG